MRRLLNLPKWIDGIWLLLLAVYVIAGTDIVPFHGDESTLIYMGRDYYYHFVEGETTKLVYDKSWQISPDEQYLRLLNGTIPKYLFGWTTYLGGTDIDDIHDQWVWGSDYQFNQDTERIPDNHVLNSARMVSAIQHSLFLIVAFAVAIIVFNRPTAYITSLYLTLNPLLLMNGRRAMMEGSHLMFMMIAILIGILAIRHRKWWLFIAFGAICGLAVAAKHPNALVVTLFFVSMGSYFILLTVRKKEHYLTGLKYMGLLFLGGVIALSVFYSLNPAWWNTPVESAQTVMRLRHELLNIQIDIYGDYPSVPARLNGFFEFVFVAQPQYYEDPQWASFSEINDQIKNYESTLLSGLAIGGSTIGGISILLLSILGLFHFARNTLIPSEYRWLIVFWGIGICSLTFILTPLAWARYYLPVIPFVGMMLAYGVFTVLNTFWKRYTS